MCPVTSCVVTLVSKLRWILKYFNIKKKIIKIKSRPFLGKAAPLKKCYRWIYLGIRVRINFQYSVYVHFKIYRQYRLNIRCIFNVPKSAFWNKQETRKINNLPSTPGIWNIKINQSTNNALHCLISSHNNVSSLNLHIDYALTQN